MYIDLSLHLAHWRYYVYNNIVTFLLHWDHYISGSGTDNKERGD